MTFGKWLLDFFLIAAGLGALAFFGGEKLPRRWFRPDAFPYRQAAWEQNGAAYEKLGIRVWKDIFPDMSRFAPRTFRKKAGLSRDPEHVRGLILEMCSAEAVHWALIVCVTPLLAWAVPGLLGAVIALCYVLGNLLFVIIQRYNRPRLVAIQKRLEMRRKK